MNPLNQKLQKGPQAEKLALKHLQNKGYLFITANFRTKFGEIDLIVKDHNELVFVEVKARYSTQFGFPEEAVNAHKLRKISRVAEFYLQKNQIDIPSRIDVVSVSGSQSNPIINHLQNVSI